MVRQLQWGAVCAAAVLVAGGCGKPQKAGDASGGKPGGVTVSGSTTVTPLSQAWAEDFSKTPGNASISVSSGGSGVGITSLINGTTDIAQSSRAIKASEVQQAKDKGFTPKETTVAMDGLCVIVNKANPVSKLTFPQLSSIFQGKTTDWKQVGGTPGRITMVSRDKSSGSYDFFLNHVLRAGDEKNTAIQYAASAQQQQSNQAIAAEVGRNAGAIGYVGLGYTQEPGVKTVGIAKTAAGPFVHASTDTVTDGTYAISRPLFYYTKGEPAGDVKKFIDFVLSDAGQAEVTKLDFVPVKK